LNPKLENVHINKKFVDLYTTRYVFETEKVFYKSCHFYINYSFFSHFQRPTQKMGHWILPVIF